MQVFNSIIPFLLGLLVMINMIAIPASIVCSVISFFTEDEKRKAEFKKISYYALIPLVVTILVVVLWGAVALVGAF